MADEREQASVAPWPGGDVWIYVVGLLLSTVANSLVLIPIAVWVPKEQQTALYAMVATVFLPATTGLINLMKNHANGNAIQATKDKLAADAEKDRLAEQKAQAAVKASALDKQEIKEAISVNTALTVAVADRVAPEAVAEVRKGSKP